MAKFAISFCILLVACGAQGSLITDAFDEISSQVESIRTEVTSQLANLTENFNTAITTGLEFNDFISETISNLTLEWQAALEDAIDGVDVDVSACAIPIVDFDTLTSEISSSATSCADDGLEELQTQYNTTVASIESFQDQLNATATSANECLSNIFTALPCLTLVGASAMIDMATQWVELFANSASLMINLGNYSATLATCGVSSALQTALEELTERYAEYEECITNLDSTTSS